MIHQVRCSLHLICTNMMMAHSKCFTAIHSRDSIFEIVPIRRFYPAPGTILLCDFDLHTALHRVRTPEMTKRRPVVVLTPRQYQQGACVVVPLSTTAPTTPRPYHHRLPAGTYPFLHGQRDSWVKCDMLGVVGYFRLDRLRTEVRWIAPILHPHDLAQIRLKVRIALGLQGP